ncbi:MAG: lytic transglycosylase domain-containing protein [Acetobacteraceae bacterium]|nr:lytic transglycosylase domain-containing protein [Acetobacteraceae bacterium]
MRRALIVTVASFCFHVMPALAASPVRQPTDPGTACRQAINAAEREYRLPVALLQAIARVESGRADPATGAVTPWPWTINAGGQSRYFETKEEAIAAVRALRARGVKLIDVGCMQVNLHHHPQAFASLEEAFDPVANARYAAQFLTRLHQAQRSWEQAAAHYHSATPELAAAYRLKVLAAWPGMEKRLAEERRREEMIAAWGTDRPDQAGPGDGNGNGFHSVALWLARRPDLGRSRSASSTGLLDPQPARGAARPAAPRRLHLLEVAEAPPGKR